MTTFKEYSRTLHKDPIPTVQFSIRDEVGEPLLESVHVWHFEEYRGPDDKTPESQGFERVYHGLYTHPKHPGKIFGFHGSHIPIEYADKSDAYSGYYSVDQHRENELNQVSDKLMQHYDHSHYTENEQNSVKRYTHFTSGINSALIKHGGPLDAEHANYVDTLNHAVSKIGLPEDTVVYSGTNHDHGIAIHNNEVLHHPGFVSSSLSLWRAAKFADNKQGVVLAIHLPKDHPALYAEHMSHMPQERELILPRNMHFRVDHSKREMLHFNSRPIRIQHVYPHNI